MSKNKKIAIASVGVICILIAAVLFIRSPGQTIVPAPDPPIQTVETQTPAPPKKEPERDESHDKVEKVIDQATNAVVEKAPGIWAKVVDAGKWFMAFDTKHALILIGVCIFLCAIVIGNKNKKSSR